MTKNKKTVQDLLQTSISQYTEISQLMENLAQPENSPSMAELSMLGENILEKQNIAMETDKDLMSLLPDTLSDPAVASKNKIRTGLLKKIIQINQGITSNFSNIHSLMDSELRHLRKGRSAMLGYQQLAGKPGKNLNNTL